MVQLDLTPKPSAEQGTSSRVLRCYKHRYDLVRWYVVLGAVERVAKLVLDNGADAFIEVRPWKPTYMTTLH